MSPVSATASTQGVSVSPNVSTKGASISRTTTDNLKCLQLALPQHDAGLAHHYMLSEEHLRIIRRRRRQANRLGFALQLCVLRHPGRLLRRGALKPRSGTCSSSNGISASRCREGNGASFPDHSMETWAWSTNTLHLARSFLRIRASSAGSEA